MADKAKSILDRIKALFDNALPTTYQLADGTEVSISLLDVGGDFTIGGVPAPAGTYSLQDGTGVVVDATGKITSVTAPEGMAAATEYTLADGTKVQIDKMDVGGKVMQGEQPIANGDYTLEDGSKITVVGGAITVVTPKPAEAAPAPAKMTKEQVQQTYDVIATPPAAGGDQMANVVTCIKALMDYAFGWQIDDPNYNPAEEKEDAAQVSDAIAIMKTGLSKQDNEVAALKLELTKTQDTLKQALQLMTELAEAPSGDPPPTERKTVFSGDVQKTKKSSLDRFAAAAKTMAEEHKN
jgi:hypothetical protein